ncbi:DUF2239 family protein [Acidicapsa ligni]|uniref:DUF2239 family protein n=1 Tax=Acidicapsa ligni TaxID=542300 RepID=UPI0021DF7B71|nr:DUF2239 family protein [Acidicapsa ligni]
MKGIDSAVTSPNERQCTVFESFGVLARGTETEVREIVRKTMAQRETSPTRAFYDDDGEEFDPTSPDPAKIIGGNSPPEPEPIRKAGRPKLGVVAREVTLLPRHWEWLESQPGGASVALRKLVEMARRDSGPADRVRRSLEATYRFLSAMCGNAAGFEEICRALFRKDWEDFDAKLNHYMTIELANHIKTLSRKARPEYQE